MDSVGRKPWIKVSGYKWLSRDLIPGLCGTGLPSLPGHFLGKQEKPKPPLVLPSPPQLRQEAIRWALWSMGELGSGHQGMPSPLSGPQVARLSNRPVSGDSWEGWKGFEVSKVWSQVE